MDHRQEMIQVAQKWMDWHEAGYMPEGYKRGSSAPFLASILGLDIILDIINDRTYMEYSMFADTVEKKYPGLITKLNGPHGLIILKALMARRKNERTETTT